MRMSFRHSKIVCTIGPASSDPRILRRLLEAGMDVARLNFSHGSHAQHLACMQTLRTTANKLEKTIAILADLQGPKIRTGPLAGGVPVILRAGQKFTISTAKILGDSTRVNTTFLPLPKEIHRGDRILLSGCLIELHVEAVRARDVNCRVVNGGALGEHKGINLPGVQLRVPALTPKDKTDLKFALAQGADYIAVSFVRRPEDVLLAKSLIRRAGKETPVIAKLEKPEAIENLEGILRVSDGVMVARGDLGVEMKWIVVFTHSGFTARLISRYRPLVPIAAFSPEAETRRRLALLWGVVPLEIPDLRKVDQLAEISEKRLLEEKLVRKGDVIAIVAGTPMGVRGTTNFMKFHVIGGGKL